jgi:hypothetical protein
MEICVTTAPIVDSGIVMPRLLTASRGVGGSRLTMMGDLSSVQANDVGDQMALAS